MVDMSFISIYWTTWRFNKYITLSNSLLHKPMLNAENKRDNNITDMISEYHVQYRISCLLYYCFLLLMAIIIITEHLLRARPFHKSISFTSRRANGLDSSISSNLQRKTLPQPTYVIFLNLIKLKNFLIMWYGSLYSLWVIRGQS